MSLAVPSGAFKLIAGVLKRFYVRCDSGRIKICFFCPECGTRIYHQTGNNVSVKAGTLDDTSWLKPDSHYYTMRKQSWVLVPDGVLQFSDDG